MSVEEKGDAKKPARMRHLQRRDAIILGVTATVLIGGIGGISLYRSYQQVWFINGLDVPVTVEVDGKRIDVDKQGRVDRALHEGVHEVRVLSASGAVIDEGPIDIPGRYDAVVYNVLGAAPLYRASVIYSRYQGSDANNNTLSFLGGRRLAAESKAEYVFTEPPKTITVEQSSSSVTRVSFNVGPGGWLSTLNYLEHQSDMMKAAALARAVARAEPGDERAFGYAEHFTEIAEGVTGTLRFLRAEKSRVPDDINVHLSYLAALRRDGRTAEARAEIEPKYRANPGSPFHGVLFSRVATRDEARAVYEDLLKSHPDDPLVLQNAGRFAFGELDHPRASELFGRLKDDPQYRHYLDEQAAALVGAGRLPEALALVSKYASAEATQDIQLAVLYARIARLPGATGLPAAPRAYVDMIARKPNAWGANAWASSLLGDGVALADLDNLKISSLAEDHFRRTIEIQVAASRDPKEAQEKCASASAAALERLNVVVATLVAAELSRSGAPDLAEKIMSVREDYPLPWSALLRYTQTGVEHPDLWRLEPEVRAALDFVRARQLEDQGQPAAALDEAVTKRDVLQGFVSLARKNWPKLGAAKDDKGKKPGLALKGAAGRPKAADKAPPSASRLVVLRREKQP